MKLFSLLLFFYSINLYANQFDLIAKDRASFKGKTVDITGKVEKKKLYSGKYLTKQSLKVRHDKYSIYVDFFLKKKEWGDFSNQYNCKDGEMVRVIGKIRPSKRSTYLGTIDLKEKGSKVECLGDSKKVITVKNKKPLVIKTESSLIKKTPLEEEDAVKALLKTNDAKDFFTILVKDSKKAKSSPYAAKFKKICQSKESTKEEHFDCKALRNYFLGKAKRSEFKILVTSIRTNYLIADMDEKIKGQGEELIKSLKAIFDAKEFTGRYSLVFPKKCFGLDKDEFIKGQKATSISFNDSVIICGKKTLDNLFLIGNIDDDSSLDIIQLSSGKDKFKLIFSDLSNSLVK